LLARGKTLGTCIEKARLGIERSGVRGEILVADNGSKDDSVQIAERLGARVIHVKEKGYGNALRGGHSSRVGEMDCHERLPMRVTTFPRPTAS
jgi:glycosyltransferase involved in cell wall biosynthesis